MTYVILFILLHHEHIIAWIGTQDLSASQDGAGLGLADSESAQPDVDIAVLIANQGGEALSTYMGGEPQTSATLDGRAVELPNPTDFREIYQLAGDAIRSALDEHREENPNSPASALARVKWQWFA